MLDLLEECLYVSLCTCQAYLRLISTSLMALEQLRHNLDNTTGCLHLQTLYINFRFWKCLNTAALLGTLEGCKRRIYAFTLIMVPSLQHSLRHTSGINNKNKSTQLLSRRNLNATQHGSFTFWRWR